MTIPAPGNDRVCLVTGASSGIGAEMARELVRRGHQVVLVARSKDKLETLAQELRADGGVAHVVPADLSDRAARAGLLERVAGLGVVVDVLVNNAGYSTLGLVKDADPEDEMAMVEVDVVAVVDLCTRFLPGMVERGRGGILNVASTAAFQPLPGQAGYGAGKAFVLSYTQSLAGELHGTGITATCLCPGPVATGFGERAGFEPGEFDKALPSIMWVPADDVARCGLDGLDKGRLYAVPGLVNRVAAQFSQVAPTSALLALLRRMHPALNR
jgi:short-subunit dehydrogenase